MIRVLGEVIAVSVRPRPGGEVPELTARIARAANPAGTTAMWVRDRLDGLWRDEDFEAWYPRDGRPGLSPAQLATVCVLQFLHGHSDRAAAEAVRCRIDFKYALGLDLDDPGFHHSVLTDFRDRLLEDDRADVLLDLALERIKKAGMIKERGTARTDSTYVLAHARDLTTLELVSEAIRATLEELARDGAPLLDALIDEEWAERYGRPVRLGKQPTRPAARLKQAGQDAHLLLRVLIDDGPRGRQAEALRQIFLQYFLVEGHGQVRPRTEKDGLPPGSLRIVSPYETEARWAIRGDTRWSGYLVHATETADPDFPNVITDVATTGPVKDSDELPAIHDRLERRGLLPEQHLADGGYVTVGLLDAAAGRGVTLTGPVKDSGSWQQRRGDGFAREQFHIDFDKRQVTCPRGKTSGNWLELPSQAPYTLVRFDKRYCDPCPDRERCTRSREGRSITFLPRHLHERQQNNRAQQQDPQWLRTYGSRAGVEGTMSEIVNGHAGRHCRYRGQAKTHVQHVLTAIAINIERLDAHESPEYRPRQLTSFQGYLVKRGYSIPRWWRGKK
jgi:transposase